MTPPWSSGSLRFLSPCAEWPGRWWGIVDRRAWPEEPFAAHKSAGMEGHATDGAQVCHEGWPDGAVVMHKGAGMEGHATGGVQVCREGWPDGAVVVHKGAGMEGQMVGGWIKRFPPGPGL